MMSTIDERMKKAIDVRPDGSLHDGDVYVNWRPGDVAATLDGAFSSAELRWIADHMDRFNGQAERK